MKKLFKLIVAFLMALYGMELFLDRGSVFGVILLFVGGFWFADIIITPGKPRKKNNTNEYLCDWNKAQKNMEKEYGTIEWQNKHK